MVLCQQQLVMAVAAAATVVAHSASEQHAQSPLLPKWAPTYSMSRSTILQPCNYSGLYDYDAYPALARFGIVDFDVSECVHELVAKCEITRT